MTREQEKSKEKEEWFYSLAEDNPSPVCFIDTDWLVTFANASFCQFIGLERAHIVSFDFFSLFSKKQGEQIRFMFESLKPEAPICHCEPHVYGGTGIECWERWNLRASFDKSGTPTGYQVLGQDITLKEESSRIQHSITTVFNKAPMCFAYCEDLVIKRITHALCDMVGHSKNEILRHSVYFPDLFLCEKDRYLFEFDEDSGNAPTSFHEVSVKRKDGSIVDTLMFMIPVQLDAGHLGHFLFFQDISEQKEMERQHLRTDLVVQHSPVVLFQGDYVKGIPLNYVSENIDHFGYRAHDLVSGKTFLNALVHPEDLPRILELAKKDNESRIWEREYTYRFKAADGQYRWVNQKGRVIPEINGEPASLVGILMDVTKQKETERALYESHLLLHDHVTKLETAWEQTIGLLAAVTELRDPYTMGHQKKVAHLSGAIAKEMGLPEDLIQETVRAALVHDIGKIQIPNDYLTKPGRLNAKEFAIIQDHAQIGADLLGKIDLPWRIEAIVVQHHERLDGSGYPKGLEGEEIMLQARIIAVADVVEAMASHRPYRPALGLEKALDEISAKAGKLYDPQVVDACRCLFLERCYQWEVD